MVDILAYWYLFPIAILIATIAMSSGTDGAIFFSPLFMLGLELEPKVAIGTALVTEVFGFTSGFIAYVRAKLIDYSLAGQLLIFSVPLAIFGALVADWIPDQVLKGVFALGVLFITYHMYRDYKEEHEPGMVAGAEETVGEKRCVIDRKGRRYDFVLKQKWLGRTFSAIGGFFVGTMSAGLAEILEYRLVSQCRVPAPVAVATTIMVVVITVFFAAGMHAYHFFHTASSADMERIGYIVMYTIPGVLLGGQLGPWVQSKVDERQMQPVLIGLFLLISIIMGFMAIMGK